jgi:L-ascorbate metabolism protein UlaG (beta-lactamase superfamily)
MQNTAGSPRPRDWRIAVTAPALVIAVQAFVPAAATPVLSRVSASATVRYVANAGVLVTIGEAQVLIDAPIREGIPPYATSTSAERERLEAALPPYDGVTAVLITHWHEDHFSAEAVAAHLSRNTRAALVSSPEVVERVRTAAPGLPAGRLRAVLPPPGASELVRIGRLPIRVLRIRHNPTRRLPEQHVGFLVGEGPAVLHTGDADPKADNFAVLRDLPRVDLALVPFWFMLTEADRQFVREAISPQRIAAMHVPPEDAQDVGRRFADANVRAVLLVTPGTVVR